MDLLIIEETPKLTFSSDLHCTDFFEIMLFAEGNGYILLDTEKIEITKSTFLFISPFQKRRWYVNGKKLKGYFLIFEKDFLNELFSDKLFVYRLQYFYNRKVKPAFIPNKRLFSFKHDILDEILQEIKNYQNDSPHLLRSILYYMLIKLNREFCLYHNLENDTQLNNYAYRFKVALENNIKEKHLVEDYTELLGISRISLNTCLKKQFGETTTNMIKERLIYEIKSELLYSTKSINEIAYELNFSEPNNLIRMFKTKTGTTPNAFRQTYQIDSSFL